MYGAPPVASRSHILWQLAPLYRALCTVTKPRRTDLRLIKHRPWFALYPQDEFVSGISRALDFEMGALLIPSIPLR
jgi:hypothetical protein